MLHFALFVHVFALRPAGGIIESGGVEVDGLLIPISPAILRAGSILFGLAGPNISGADTSIPGNKTTASRIEASNFCAIAVIMGAWATPSGERISNGL